MPLCKLKGRMTRVPFRLCVTLLIGILCHGCAQKNAIGAEPTTALPGSELSAASACQESNLVILARSRDMGRLDFAGAGKSWRNEVRLDVWQAFAGQPPHRLFVSIPVQTIGLDVPERAPEPGKPFIFFINDHGDGIEYEVLKVIEADAANLRLVQGLGANNRGSSGGP